MPKRKSDEESGIPPAAGALDPEPSPDSDIGADEEPEGAPPPGKPARASRKRKTPVKSPESENPDIETGPDPPPKSRAAKTMRPPARRRATDTQILTIEARDDVETPEAREAAIWHEIQNALRTRKMLTGVLGGIEQTEAKKTIAIVYYKDLRVAIPISEMNLAIRGSEDQTYSELMLRQNKLLGNMLGAEIDFVVRGIDSKTRSVAGSRTEAMMKKRQLFYFGTELSGNYRLYEGRIVQARVIAVAEKGIRVEIFGVECSIMARDLSWDWIGDAHDRYNVGDEVLVRILKIRRESLEDVAVKADIKSVAGDSGRDNLMKCRIQGKYAGTVTDIHRGVVFIRLSIGVNAIAHACYDRRMPGKKDEVSFAVTHIDEVQNVAVGIITRIIKQHL